MHLTNMQGWLVTGLLHRLKHGMVIKNTQVLLFTDPACCRDVPLKSGIPSSKCCCSHFTGMRSTSPHRNIKSLQFRGSCTSWRAKTLSLKSVFSTSYTQLHGKIWIRKDYDTTEVKIARWSIYLFISLFYLVSVFFKIKISCYDEEVFNYTHFLRAPVT